MDYNARYYSPLLGRFVSPDSIVPEPSSSGGFNRYRYVRNNPLRYSDPTGHQGGSFEDALRYAFEDMWNEGADILDNNIGQPTRQTVDAASQVVQVDYVTNVPATEPVNSTAAKKLGGIAYGADVAASAISAGGATVQIIAAPAGPEGQGVAIVAYEATVGKAENFLGAVSASSTLFGDYATGNTYISSEHGLVVGQDSYVSLANTVAGFVPAGGVYDSISNWEGTAYSLNSFADATSPGSSDMPSPYSIATGRTLNNDLPGNVGIKGVTISLKPVGIDAEGEIPIRTLIKDYLDRD